MFKARAIRRCGELLKQIEACLDNGTTWP